MEVTIKRDGIQLHGMVQRPNGVEKGPALILFHGFGGDMGAQPDSLFEKLAKLANEAGLTAVRFDFDGHGESGGRFSDMDVLRELLDAIEILKYVRRCDFVTEVYLLGHSQGGVVAGMLAGLYPDQIKKLMLLAPAASLKTDARKGNCMGTVYDTEHIPEEILVDGRHRMGGHYFRIAKNLPIFELTSQFHGETLILHGRYDAIVDCQTAKSYHEWLPQSKCLLFEELDHGIEGADQPLVLEEIHGFLNENRGA